MAACMLSALIVDHNLVIYDNLKWERRANISFYLVILTA